MDGTWADVTLLRPLEWLDEQNAHVGGTFYYLISVLDGASRYLVRWELRESMREADVELVLQRAKEMFPKAYPRIISDNGPQFIAKDFKEFIRQIGMTHVRTSPYYPQSNGKLERWHGSLKQECIRPGVPLSLDDARAMVGRFVDHYNHIRLHSALGYITPADRLANRQDAIHAERDQKLAEARRRRALRRRNLTPEGLPQKSTAEGASQGVQRGGNEHPLVCVNAINIRGVAAPIRNLDPTDDSISTR